MMNKSDDDLNHLLFSGSSHYNEYNYRDDKEQVNVLGTYIGDEQTYQFEFKLNNKQPWRQSETSEHQFMQVNGPSIEFQNCSNSMMQSQKPEEESRYYKYETGRDYKLLEKKGEDVDSILQKELAQAKQQLKINNLQVSKLQTILKTNESKLKIKQSDIVKLQMTLSELQSQLQNIQAEKDQCLQMMAKKDDFFTQYRKEMAKLFQDLNEKQLQNQMQQEQIVRLSHELQHLKSRLNMADGLQTNTKDRKNHAYLQTNITKRSSNSERDLQRLRRQLSQVRQHLSDKQNRLKLIEEENRKKMIYKERKTQELQERIGQLKQDNLRSNTQSQLDLEKCNGNLRAKVKQITSLNQKIEDCDKRIKSLLAETRKKDEKIRDITIELLQKGREMDEAKRELEQNRVKLQFDHLVITEKEQEIERLHQERKSACDQLQTNKSEKVDKNQKTRKQKEEKMRKDLDCLRKNYDNSERERNQLLSALREANIKIDQATNKAQKFRQQYFSLEQKLKIKTQQSERQWEEIEKTKRELGDHKKKADLLPELRNKIIILESRLKQSQNQRKSHLQQSNSANMIDKMEALEHRLEQREREIRELKNELKSSSTQDQHISEQYEQIKMRMEDGQEQIERLLQDLQKKELLIEELKKSLQFKDQTLEYTHKKLMKSQNARIELEQEKKMLQEKLFYGGEEGNQQQIGQISQFYQAKIHSLQQHIHCIEDAIKQKEDQLKTIQEEHKFETRQLKERLKQLSNIALQTRERKMTPQNMSQEQTVSFLTKTIKRAYRSTDMLKLLEKNRQFTQILIRMEKQFRK